MTAPPSPKGGNVPQLRIGSLFTGYGAKAVIMRGVG